MVFVRAPLIKNPTLVTLRGGDTHTGTHTHTHNSSKNCFDFPTAVAYPIHFPRKMEIKTCHFSFDFVIVTIMKVTLS